MLIVTPQTSFESICLKWTCFQELQQAAAGGGSYATGGRAAQPDIAAAAIALKSVTDTSIRAIVELYKESRQSQLRHNQLRTLIEQYGAATFAVHALKNWVATAYLLLT
ncbi:hypothetical protein C0Z16_34585 [Paraburkholderia rhynchosiae]|uniref:Uncharacterized protein n=1 Tax=Paraburkholderia rhynchosiae TaxID=487049 RepID=A0ABX4UVF2_9BURK|nr:hypothetical protein C0Z16_34585 [Paraburkholderia rhynchosiae]